MVIELSAEKFDDEILGYGGKALVDFWATWCGPCKMLSPIIDEIAEENEDIKVCKVDCDENMELATSFGIMAIPCVLYFENGELKDRSVGLTTKEDLLNMMNK